MRKLGRAGCSSGRPEGRSRGVRADRGRARGSHRLQKSTGGVWPVTPTSEELVDHDGGSSLFARERRSGERTPEAESSAAKPRDRWRVPKKRRNTRKRSCRRHSVDGRRSGPGKPPSLTRWWWKRFWLLAQAWVSGWRGARQGASEVDRQLRPRSKTPWRGGAAFGRMPGSSLQKGGKRRERVGQSWSCAPSSARPAGVGSSKGGLAPSPALVIVASAPMGALGDGRRSGSYAPGSRAIRGCSGCESVAEVGEKHLLYPLEGSREASRARVGVARGGGPVSLTRAGSHRVG
jgi:hypothetical protein